MRRSVFCVAVVVAALAVPAAAHAARLTLAGTRPVAVRGTLFHRGERVTVTIQSRGRRRVRHVTASRAGTFKLTFPSATPPCGDWRAMAVGTLGSRALLAGMKFPDCIVR